MSVEFGLCEVLNTQTIKLAPSDGKWGFDISELEALLPAGTVDHTVERVFKEVCCFIEVLQLYYLSDETSLFSHQFVLLHNHLLTQDLV